MLKFGTLGIPIVYYYLQTNLHDNFIHGLQSACIWPAGPIVDAAALCLQAPSYRQKACDIEQVMKRDGKTARLRTTLQTH